MAHEGSGHALPGVDELRRIALDAGLDEVGVCTAAPFHDARHILEERKRSGLHGGMNFTFGKPQRSTDPGAALAGARALVVAALAYRETEPEAPAGPGPSARVAAYAWEDRYRHLRRALEAVAQRLRAGGWRTRVLVDDNALVDRAAAVRAGIGWFGKSSNVLIRGRGSWFVLGSVVTDAPLVAADPEPVADGCGSCRRCLDGCPTGAITAPGVVDARRCLSWLLQAPGVFPREHRIALGDRIYGCDDCQLVCPPNRREDRAGRPDASPHAEAWVPVLDLLSSSDEEILERHGRWYIAGRAPRWVRRNALVVLANVGDPSEPAVVEAIASTLASSEPVVRAHAVWAAHRLGLDHLLATLDDERDPMVLEELAAVGW